MDFESKLNIAKIAIRWTVIGGTSKIVHGIVTDHTDPETLYQKVQIAAGAFAIGGMLANHVGDHTDKQVDEIANFGKKIYDRYQENKTSK